MSDEKFVTRSECAKTTLAAEAQTAMVLKALVGEDLRGGLVKDVADTKKDIGEIKASLKRNNGNNGDNGCSNHNGGGLSRKEKAAVYVALITSLSSTATLVTVEAIRALA